MRLYDVSMVVYVYMEGVVGDKCKGVWERAEV